MEKDQLKYFFEWGSPKWVDHFTSILSAAEIEKKIKNKTVLDIGTRNGKMASLFALLGAKHVTGTDVEETDFTNAWAEADKHSVRNKVDFLHTNGTLDEFRSGSFDFVFTKSVLVVVDKLPDFLTQIDHILSPQGSVLFMENSHGNKLTRMLRSVKHRNWDNDYVNYFDTEKQALVGKSFQINKIETSSFPPIVSMAGEKFPQKSIDTLI